MDNVFDTFSKLSTLVKPNYILKNLMPELGWMDIQKLRHPNECYFSLPLIALGIMSHIDLVFVNESVTSFIQKVQYLIIISLSPIGVG